MLAQALNIPKKLSKKSHHQRGVFGFCEFLMHINYLHYNSRAIRDSISGFGF